MYEVGDIVIYPLYGTATIKKIIKKKVKGEFLEFYVLEIPKEKLTIKIPIVTAKEIGLREIISSEEAEEVLKILLKKRKLKVSKNWNRRFKRNIEKLKRNDVIDLAEVVRNLSLRQRDSGLSVGEKRMLEKARGMLVSEISYAQDINEEEALAKVESCFVKN
ncbi:MAG: CarD family transcriptional regulator [Actinobacteria bacterium]|nr:CarD family transcriptional regulator [Actinomycetota bacterium]